MPKVLNNSNAIVTYVRTERASLPARTASRPLHGKARTAFRPWTCPAPAQRHWRAKLPFCRGRWLWSTMVSPGLLQLQGRTRSLTPQPCKKWLSFVGLAWWGMALWGGGSKTRPLRLTRSDCPFGCIYYSGWTDSSQPDRHLHPWRWFLSVECQDGTFFITPTWLFSLSAAVPLKFEIFGLRICKMKLFHTAFEYLLLCHLVTKV